MSRIMVEVDQAELTVRMIESAGKKRPAGMTARAALAALDPEDEKLWRGASEAAMQYFAECVAAQTKEN